MCISSFILITRSTNLTVSLSTVFLPLSPLSPLVLCCSSVFIEAERLARERAKKAEEAEMARAARAREAAEKKEREEAARRRQREAAARAERQRREAEEKNAEVARRGE